MIKKSISLLIFSLMTVAVVSGQVQLPQLVSDGMVLQRDAEVTIWGWASAGEEVTVIFDGEDYQTTTDNEGNWEIRLGDLEAGGPYEMRIHASNQIIIEDILVGDVWVASGQSNMELSMRRVKPLYSDEIESVEYPHIRYFEVPKRYNFNCAETNLEWGHWQRTTPENVKEFSATAWFFARTVHERYDVPVGIILSALGGSPAEAWISEESLKPFPEYFQEAQQFKDSTLIREIEQNDQQRMGAWYDKSEHLDLGHRTPGEPWYDPVSTDYTSWDTMKVPGYWDDEAPGRVNGVVWFHKEIDLPEGMTRKSGKLELGRIVDADSVYINGLFVGTTSYQYPPRWYDIPQDVLREGENHIVVRIINERGRGGFIPDKPYELIVDEDTLDLQGEWNYRVGAEMEPLEPQTFIRWKPTGLYNAMISPLLNYRIKGVIWYQGESNTDRPHEYRDLFTALIADWREHWGQGEFPFLYVQLANYMTAKNQPSDTNWALLREAQLQTLTMPNTGMAVTIDIGEWNDIHPLNKKDVGERLAVSAFHVAYGEGMIHSGPRIEKLEKEGRHLTLSFKHTGSGLISKGGELKEFAIAGEDGNFVWANARIEGNSVVVWSDEVTDPAYVRYAWADNPENANFYNKEGLPASPFRYSIY